MDWHASTNVWSNLKISEYKNLELSPAVSSLHYGIQCFEGMKAYKDSKGKIRMFRPDLNMNRMDYSMRRLAMPGLDKEGFLDCIKQTLLLDADWIPSEEGYSMYIRKYI
jgi:branched-chain amino acid aminotransferase